MQWRFGVKGAFLGSWHRLWCQLAPRIFLDSVVFRRLALWMTVIFMLIALVTAYRIFEVSQKHQRTVLQNMHSRLAPELARRFDPALQQNAEALNAWLASAVAFNPHVTVYWLSPDGALLATSASDAQLFSQRVNLAPVKQFIEQGDHSKSDSANQDSPRDYFTPILGDNPRSRDPQIFSAAKVVHQGRLLGYVYAVLGDPAFEAFYARLVDEQSLWLGCSIVLSALGLGLLASLAVAASLVRPLRQLTTLVVRAKDAGFQQDVAADCQTQFPQVLLNRRDEVGDLSHAMNALLQRLQSQYTQLLSVESLRKELLTHISHDLRTPLASLMGYLETWQLSRGQLPESQRDEFVRIAIANSKKMATLIDQLFELSSLDSETVQVTHEPFSIADLVQDVLQKFALDAKNRNIDLNVTPANLGIRVIGDIPKLERVFTNLIENALRHTPDGGKIWVNLSPEGRFISIEVGDTGIGIPDADLPHIFDAHYKAGNSVRGNTAHGGMGLAITKKIIDLHQSAISVKSQVDEGTVFSFALPLAT